MSLNPPVPPPVETILERERIIRERENHGDGGGLGPRPNGGTNVVEGSLTSQTFEAPREVEQPNSNFETLSQNKDSDSAIEASDKPSTTQGLKSQGNFVDQVDSEPANPNEVRSKDTVRTDSSGAGAPFEASSSLPLSLMPPTLPGPSNPVGLGQDDASRASGSSKIAKARTSEFPQEPSKFPQTTSLRNELVRKPQKQLKDQNANQQDRSGTVAKRKRKKAPVKKKQGASNKSKKAKQTETAVMKQVPIARLHAPDLVRPQPSDGPLGPLEVAIPENFFPGDKLTVEDPRDLKKYLITIPPNATAGSVLHVDVQMMKRHQLNSGFADQMP